MVGLGCVNSTSAARSFAQIAKRGFCSGPAAAAVRSLGPLDFLLPRVPVSTADCHAAFLLRKSHLAGKHARPKVTAPQDQRRSFTATAHRNATTCILNPLTDEDGKEVTLDITPRAAKRLSEIMKKDDNPDLALRVQVTTGGCHGFQYLLSLVTIPPKDTAEWSKAVNEDDIIFQFSPDQGETESLSSNAPKVILNEPSLDMLKGSKVDYTMELIGSQFKIIDNPFAAASCGCGTSFHVK